MKLLLLLLFIPLASANLEIIGDSMTGVINLEPETSTSTSGGNLSWNMSLADENYLRLDMANDGDISANMETNYNLTGKTVKANKLGGFQFDGYEDTGIKYNSVGQLIDFNVLGYDVMQLHPLYALFQAGLISVNNTPSYYSNQKTNAGFGFDEDGYPVLVDEGKSLMKVYNTSTGWTHWEAFYTEGKGTRIMFKNETGGNDGFFAYNSALGTFYYRARNIIQFGSIINSVNLFIDGPNGEARFENADLNLTGGNIEDVNNFYADGLSFIDNIQSDLIQTTDFDYSPPHISVTTTADSTAGTVVDVFDEDEYSTYNYINNSDWVGIFYTPSNGRFTVEDAGTYHITFNLISRSSAADEFDMKVYYGTGLGGGSTIYDHEVFLHSSVDPPERSITLIHEASANYFYRFEVASADGVDTALVQDGSTVSIYKIGT